jgi:hypothetical protein
MINTLLALIEEHDHTTGKGVKIVPSALNINATVEMNTNTLSEIKTLNLYANAGTQTDSNSLWVTGDELYYRDSGGNNVQITSGTGLNGSATGGFSGDFVGNATAYYSSADTLFGFYAVTGATYDTSALGGVKASKFWMGSNTATRDDFLWDAQTAADVLSLGSDSNDDKTLNVSNIMNIATAGQIGFGVTAATAVALNAEYEFAGPASATTNVLVSGTDVGSLALGDSSQGAGLKYWDIRVNNDTFSINNLDDSLALTAVVPLSITAAGNATIAAATSGVELAVTGEVTVSSTSTFTGIVTATAGVTAGQFASTPLSCNVDDTAPNVSGKTHIFTQANTVPTAIVDLTSPTPGQIVILCGGSATNSSTIADSGNFSLSAAMTLGVDDCITLLVQADNDYIELARSVN